MISITCVVVGDSMVGKTSLLNRYTRNTFPQEHIATVFIDHFDTLSVVSKNQQIKLDLWDTAGQEGPECFKALANIEIDAFLICFSIMSSDSFENVIWKWQNEVKNLCPNAVVVLVGTMQDLLNNAEELFKLKAANKLPKLYNHGKELAMRIGAFEYCQCSAFTGQGVATVFTEVVHAVLKKRSNVDASQKHCAIS